MQTIDFQIVFPCSETITKVHVKLSKAMGPTLTRKYFQFEIIL